MSALDDLPISCPVQCFDIFLFFFFKQKTAYEIKECDWSSDVCSSDLEGASPKGWIFGLRMTAEF